jgi:hypothetical protein
MERDVRATQIKMIAKYKGIMRIGRGWQERKKGKPVEESFFLYRTRIKRKRSYKKISIKFNIYKKRRWQNKSNFVTKKKFYER